MTEQHHEHEEQTPVVIVGDVVQRRIPVLGAIAVIMALVTSTVALVMVLADNRRLERDINCLRRSAVTMDEAVSVELASLGTATALILDGLVAIGLGDDGRLTKALIHADAVLLELQDAAANLDSAVEGRRQALKTCG